MNEAVRARIACICVFWSACLRNPDRLSFAYDFVIANVISRRLSPEHRVAAVTACGAHEASGRYSNSNLSLNAVVIDAIVVGIVVIKPATNGGGGSEERCVGPGRGYLAFLSTPPALQKSSVRSVCLRSHTTATLSDRCKGEGKEKEKEWEDRWIEMQ